MSHGANNFHWQDLILVAEGILNLEEMPQEAVFRSVVSRSYYAAFSVAKEYALQCGLDQKYSRQIRSGRIHGLIRDFYSSHRIVKDQLKYLRVARNLADYENSYPGLNKKIALSHLRYAQSIITYISRLESLTIKKFTSV